MLLLAREEGGTSLPWPLGGRERDNQFTYTTIDSQIITIKIA